jgi:hypothetical protein
LLNFFALIADLFIILTGILIIALAQFAVTRASQPLQFLEILAQLLALFTIPWRVSGKGASTRNRYSSCH